MNVSFTFRSLLIVKQVKVSFVASTEGGMDIETVAEETPNKIHTINITQSTGVTDEDTEKLADAYKLAGNSRDQGKKLF